jgi:hypothetical protein
MSLKDRMKAGRQQVGGVNPALPHKRQLKDLAPVWVVRGGG